ncbi:MAG: hypothetical protein DCF22_03110 [Leptolyngbya sp.]|nr:MAG: hypothetical protein DCF22_03110 [Leptolyngbya sp.]
MAQTWYRHRAPVAIASFGLAGLCFTAIPSSAQISPDQTLGNESSIVSPNVAVHGFPAELIQGGAIRGVNLFHSFSQFNVRDGQRVYFANPVGIETILSRVTGADPSKIFGTLGVNGTANLFLINPNGILFGPNARLDVAGSFLASTASSFKFPDGSEFSATNPQAPPLLTVNIRPGLQYGANHQATIANAGNLTAGKDLTLAAGNLDLQGQLQAGGDLTLRALDTVKIRDRLTTPFIAAAGGALTVQGDSGIDIFALNHLNSGLFSGGDLVLRSNSAVGGDAHYTAGGDFRIETLNATLGNLVSPHDPVIRAQGNVIFNDYTGASLHILAGGSVIVSGTIFITAPDGVNGLVETMMLSDGKTVVNINGRTTPTLDIRAGTTAVGIPIGLTGAGVGFIPAPIIGITPTNADIRLGTIFTPANSEGLVLLTNQYQPNALNGSIQVNLIDTSVNSFLTNGGAVFIDSRSDVIASTLNTSASIGSGGRVVLFAKGSIATDAINAATSSLISLNGGEVTLQSTGNLTTGEIRTDGGLFGAGGAINLTSTAGTIGFRPGSQVNSATYGAASSGNIALTARAVDITPGTSLITSSFATGAAGNITINSPAVSLSGAQLLAVASNVGSAGAIAINTGTTGTVTFQDRSVASSFTIGTGAAGAISINTGQLTVQNSAIASVTLDAIDLGLTGFTGGGQGGNLTINAAESVNLMNTLPTNVFDFDVETPAGISTISAPVGLFSRSQSSGKAGDIQISTQQLVVEGGASIATSTSRSGQAGSLIVNASSSVELSGTSLSAQSAGELVRVSTGLFTEADANSTGNAGSIEIDTRRLLVRDGAVVSTSAAERTSGRGGDLTIRADTVEVIGTSADVLNRSALITATVGTGDAGNLMIDTRQLWVLNGGVISSSTLDQGRSGSLTINASESVNLIGTAPDTLPSTLATSTAGTGDGGTLTLQTRRLVVLDGALVSAATYNQGVGGNLHINASEAVELAGQARDGRPGGLSAGSGIEGYSQVIDRLLQSFQIDKQIDTSKASGAGGNVRVATNSLTLRDGATISTETIGPGMGGDILVQASTVSLNTAAQVSARTSGAGAAGDIVLQVGDHLSLTGLGTGLFANTESQSTGRGGSIFVTAPTSLIQDGAGISVGSRGQGQGGNIQVSGRTLTLRDRAYLTAETLSTDGGNIAITLADLLVLRRNSLISTTAGTAQRGGNGGNITIYIPDGFIVAVRSENSDIAANAFTGNGGQVNITAYGIFGIQPRPKLTPFSDITASSQFGINGTILLSTPNVDPSRGLVAFPGNLVDPARQIAQTCVPQGAARANSFTITGRAGLPASPDEPLQSQEGLADWVIVQDESSPFRGNGKTQSSLPLQVPSLIEAQGWVQEADGTIALIAHAPNAVPAKSWLRSPDCGEKK